ncbi:TetR family transcriptional regulator [Rhizobium sp. ERR 922]|uniref:TetR/AcrR family transcriptional regulator n=1 Tax=unclassified Rhizobium TaxID=2613769 RepID=UPI0011A5FB41|nr:MULTISPECIES: TetR/AcrR family transcriptional regulator [unclassified Rhizobium]TWB51880.1 TetR family transcriptional regulator [Rhizobium sp. ERR 922]TWB94302.1 TetR family transcriptional regulator [Rhizobium sp. ERR 942]
MVRTVFERSDAIALVAEVFRELGYEGASLSEITARTKLSKGSLYHFFPGGKEEMAAEIMANIDAWFVTEIFKPLEEGEPRSAIARMWETTDSYFRSGRRVCLIGAFALDETRDRFSTAIRNYFHRWVEALAGALLRAGAPGTEAKMLAEEAVIGIQGALTLARALGDEAVFGRTLARLKRRLETALG